MLLPIGDDNRDRRTTPVVTWTFAAVNVLVFLFLQGFGTNDRFTYAMATVPQEILTGTDLATGRVLLIDPISGSRRLVPGLQPTPISVYITLLTSMFMHGGLAHIIGNMLYLLIFGDNVEDRMGHVRFAVFYLLCGVLATLAHVFTSSALGTGLQTPTLGASGAISAVLGAYIVLFPRKRIRVIAFRFLFTSMSAVAVVGIWFLFQLISGIGLLGGGTQAGGVAYAAHIGGFVAGLLLVWIFAQRR